MVSLWGNSTNTCCKYHVATCCLRKKRSNHHSQLLPGVFCIIQMFQTLGYDQTLSSAGLIDRGPQIHTRDDCHTKTSKAFRCMTWNNKNYSSAWKLMLRNHNHVSWRNQSECLEGWGEKDLIAAAFCRAFLWNLLAISSTDKISFTLSNLQLSIWRRLKALACRCLNITLVIECGGVMAVQGRKWKVKTWRVPN